MILILNIANKRNQAEAIRQSLEFFGYDLVLKNIHRPKELIDTLSTWKMRSIVEYIIICGDGLKDAFIMPDLVDSVYEDGEPQSRLEAKTIKKLAKLSGQTVISTACNTFCNKLSKSFISAGAKNYIGPKDIINSNAALYFVQTFFYEITQHGVSVKTAYKIAKLADEETNKFKLRK